MAAIANYRVVTRNEAHASENKIHSDDIAKKYGFTGALVPGVTVYGHMTYPLVREFGEQWLARAVTDVRFLKPAYDGDELGIDVAADGDGHIVEARNSAGTLLARLTTTIPARAAAPDPRWRIASARSNPPRVEISAASIVCDKPLAAIRSAPSAADNTALANSLSDDLPIWRKPPADIQATPLHPYWLARSANHAFTNGWVMPAWIHVGTRFVMHRALRITQAIELRTIPTRVWENKGHEFATLYLAWLVDGELAAEAEHTAIFRIAER